MESTPPVPPSTRTPAPVVIPPDVEHPDAPTVLPDQPGTPGGHVHATGPVPADAVPVVKGIALPCLIPRLVPRDRVRANDYNPNSVSPDKMELLEQSIRDNGFCFPVVVIHDPETDGYVIIDGFHRFTVMGPGYLDLPVLPVVVLPHDMARRLYATVQFNKARGHHQVDLDAEVIRRLLAQGQTEEEVSQHLGIDLDTVHRYKQVTGIAELFSHSPYSLGWEMEER